jgi:predicted Zn-dependent protease
MNLTRLISSLATGGFIAAALFAPVPLTAQQTRGDAEKDPVLKAMLTEMDRSMSQLQLKGFAKPFFIQYRIEDADDFQTKAEFGATEGSQRAHQRVVRVTVRVGDYRTDSSGGRGDGALQLTALDDDPIALRSALWAATDQAYKAALSAFAQKQAALKQVQTSPQADDFSHEKPIISLADTSTLKIDEGAWNDRVARDSGLYKEDPQARAGDGAAGDGAAEYSKAQFQGRVINTRLVTSEGSVVRKSEQQYMEVYSVGTQAPDGMRLDRSYTSVGSSLKDLDTPEVFGKHALEVTATLDELRKAPLVEEEYHGPVLLSADAGADTLRGLLAGGMAATRPRLGTEARTNGPFASSYHASVLPQFIDVVDDPALKSFNGKGLVGAYDIDDEGVPAQDVKLVTAGKLENYLLSRTPVRDFPASNGHGRAGITGPAQPAISVFKVTATNGLSDDELNSKLQTIARDRGLKSAYYVQTLGGLGTPRLLYRISADGSGKRELVRGAALDDVDQRALRSSVTAAGKDLYIANYFGDIPQTVLAPALLFEDATIRRANEKNGKLPFYPPPE